MKIEPDTKYDFSDVLLKPKRSKLSSRSQVSLEKTITFPNSKFTWTGIPLMVANMDTTGTFEMYRALSKYKIITCLHKHYNVEDYPDDLDPNYYAISSGITENDRNKLDKLIARLNPHFVVIDVANG